LAGIPPQGQTPWLQALVNRAPKDDNNGTRDLPWLTPTLTPKGKRIRWTSSANALAVTTNTTLLFCPGSILNCEVQSFLAGPTLPNSRFCTSIYFSIANPWVFHLALHTGSDTGKEFGLHTLPRTILRQLEACEDATWWESFRLLPTMGPTSSSTGEIPKHLSLCFGAHTNSICGSALGSRADPLPPPAPTTSRAAHAVALKQRQPLPPIMGQNFSTYESALANLLEEPTPVTLLALKTPQHSPEDMVAEDTRTDLGST